MAALVDTNVLIYRFDRRFPVKQKAATHILRRGIDEGSLRVPHQAIVEFVAAATRRIRGHVILEMPEALREAEEMLKQFPILYPNEVTTNLTYQAILGTIEIGVTGRSEIQQLLSRALEPRLLSVLMAQAVTDDILMAIRQAGYVIVPEVPTKEMLDEGWYEAHDENALGTWTSMIAAYESSGKSATGNG